MFSPSLCTTWVHPSIAKVPARSRRSRSAAGANVQGLARSHAVQAIGQMRLRLCRHRQGMLGYSSLFDSIETFANLGLKNPGVFSFTVSTKRFASSNGNGWLQLPLATACSWRGTKS